jgi:hypothetical protein
MSDFVEVGIHCQGAPIYDDRFDQYCCLCRYYHAGGITQTLPEPFSSEILTSGDGV